MPDTRRYDALVALLARWDVDDTRRTHRLTCVGAPDRQARWADLPRIWVALQRQAREEGTACRP